MIIGRKTILQPVQQRIAFTAGSLEVSQAYAYKLIKKLNEEQEAQGYLTMHGRLNREYFYEKIYKKS